MLFFFFLFFFFLFLFIFLHDLATRLAVQPFGLLDWAASPLVFEICKLSSLSLNQALNCPTQSLDEFPARLTEFDAVLPLPPVEQVLLGGRISFVTPGDCAALSLPLMPA